MEMLSGLPPTGRSVSLPGIDVIDISNERIKTLRGYFDGTEVPKQLGREADCSSGPFFRLAFAAISKNFASQ